MGQLLINLFVALAWAYFFEPFSWLNLFLGYGVGAVLTWLAVRAEGRRFYLAAVWGGLRLVVRLVWEQLKSTVWVSRLVLAPQDRRQPGIVGVPVTVREDWQRVLVANMITLTPGTVSVRFSPDRSRLYIHVVDLKAPDEIAEAEQLFERLVRGVWD